MFLKAVSPLQDIQKGKNNFNCHWIYFLSKLEYLCLLVAQSTQGWDFLQLSKFSRFTYNFQQKEPMFLHDWVVALKRMKCPIFKGFKDILYTLKFSNNYLIKCSAQTLTELTQIEKKYRIRILFMFISIWNSEKLQRYLFLQYNKCHN